MMVKVNLFVIGGNGNVGSEFVRQIVNKDYPQVNIVGLAAIEGFIFNKKGISREDAIKFTQNSLRIEEHPGLDAILDLVVDSYLDDVIFVDITAGKEELLNFHKRVIKDTSYKIVTANKNPLALCDFKTFKLLTSDRYRYGYRVTVMAGAESIYFLRDMYDLQEEILSIEGMFSGTLGYITTQMEKGVEFSKAVYNAKLYGYTEPHPRDDLNGLDVSRKLLILLRTLGYDIDLKDISLKPFIADEYLKEDNVELFLKSLSQLDGYFKDRISSLLKDGKTLRYVASFRNKEMKVQLEEVDLNSPLGLLKGTLNKIVIKTESYYDNNYFVVEAPGAGPKVTALNLRRDVLSLM